MLAEGQDLYARYLLRCGRPREAKELIEASIGTSKNATRPENPQVLLRECVLVHILAQLGMGAEAVALSKATLDTLKKEIPVGTPSLCTAYIALGTAYVAEGMADLAKEAVGGAEEVLRESLKDDEGCAGSVEEIEIYILYAACERLKGAHEEALERLSQADRVVERLFPAVQRVTGGICEYFEHFEHWRILYLRGEILLKMRRVIDAAQELSRAVEGYGVSFGQARPHWCSGAAQAELSIAYTAMRRKGDAKEASIYAKEVLEDALGALHWRSEAARRLYFHAIA